MILSLLGWIGYVLLVLQAIVWAKAIRTNLTLMHVGTLFSGFLLAIFAIVVPVFGINRLHSYWMLALPVVGMIALTKFLARMSASSFAQHAHFFLMDALRPFADFYAKLVRIGITADRLSQGREEYVARMNARFDSANFVRTNDIDDCQK